VGWVVLKFKKLIFTYLVQLWVISIFLVLPQFNYTSSAQELENASKEETKNEETVEEEATGEVQKVSAAYEVLGRALTDAEKDLYEGLDPKELKQELLPKEQRLVIARALLALGEGQNVEVVLKILPILKLETFSEFLNKFKLYKEEYGSVVDGLLFTLVYNIKDDEQAFKHASARAYEEVFGIPKEKQNTSEIINFLKENNALTYSKMIAALMETMTPEVKKRILFKILDEIDRKDLKLNEKFVEKMLGQKFFTHESLKRLLEQVGTSKPTKDG